MGRKKKIKEITDIDLRDYKKPKTVLIFQDPSGIWVGMCIEHNFISQGMDIGNVMDNFEIQYKNQVQLDLTSNIEPMSNFSKTEMSILEGLYKNKTIRNSMLKWNFQYKD